MFKPVLYAGAAIAALTAPAFADETVVVAATRVATPLREIASSVTVIDAAQIEARQDRTLPDVLRQVPGLSITQTGGPGGQTSLFMRGTNANHVKVVLDGIDLSDPSTTNGVADISKLLAGDIARVEVLRGPQGALYGSDAIGGVVNIITKAGEGPMTLSGSLEAGSFDTFNQTASLSGSDGGFHYIATVQHLRVGATPVTPLDLLQPGEKRNDDFFDAVTASTKLSYDLSDALGFSLVARTTNSLGKITGDAFDFTTFESFPSPARTRISTIQYDTRGAVHWAVGRLDQTLGLAYGSTIIATQDPDNGDSRTIGDRVKLDWQGNVAVADGHTLVLGAETYRDALHPGQAFGFPSTLAQGITTNAGFAELQSDFGGGLFASASVRYDDNSRFGDKTTWRVAPAWVIESTGTKFKASAGSGFKAPSLQQLYGTFGGNPLLKPETSFGYDAGVEQGFGDVTGGVTWFQNQIRNLIVSGGAPLFQLSNIGRARTQGVESFVTWQAMETLKLTADYTYTDAIDAGTHLELLRRPRNKISLNADWQATEALLLDATLLHVGPQVDGNRDFSIPRLKMPGVTTLDLAASYKLEGPFALFGRIENALDETYQSPDGFLRPGIGVTAGIKAAL